MALGNIAFYSIGGFSIIALLGILTFVFLLLTAYAGYGVMKGKMKLSLHKKLAIIVVIIALIHAFLVIGSKYF